MKYAAFAATLLASVAAQACEVWQGATTCTDQSVACYIDQRAYLQFGVMQCDPDQNSASAAWNGGPDWGTYTSSNPNSTLWVEDRKCAITLVDNHGRNWCINSTGTLSVVSDAPAVDIYQGTVIYKGK